MKPKARSSLRATYANFPYQCSIPFNEEYFLPVDVHFYIKGLSVVGKWFTPQPKQTSRAQTLKEAFNNIHPPLKQICGKIHLPPDDCHILGFTTRSQNSLFSASDASLKDGRATNAWILSSGKANDIMNPLMNISGSGPVHGAPQYLSSACGELQGITALTTVAKIFTEYFNTRPKSTFVCDNTGVQKKISQGNFRSLRSQRDTNIDLYLTQREWQGNMKVNLEWVKVHLDKTGWKNIQNLVDQKLS